MELFWSNYEYTYSKGRNPVLVLGRFLIENIRTVEYLTEKDVAIQY